MQLSRSLFVLLLLVLSAGACSSKKISEQELWQQSTRPGAPHAVLSSLVGDWETKTTYWAKKESKPYIARGEARVQDLFESRFIQEEFSGKAYGRPFSGLGIMGFDNVKDTYTSFWIDSLGTAMSVAEGSYDPERKVFEFRGSFMDPVTKKKVQTRSVLTLPNRDFHKLELFESADGGEFKTLEVEYARTRKLAS